MSNALLVVETGDDACLSNLVAQKRVNHDLGSFTGFDRRSWWPKHVLRVHERNLPQT